MKIIAGGQTGADLGALLAAYDVGLHTGGYAYKGYRNENGYADKRLQQQLGLIDKQLSYKQRTQSNIVTSDATLIIAKYLQSVGTALMLQYVVRYNKPHFVFRMTYKQNDYTVQKHALIEWLLGGQYVILNVGGNRESVAPGIRHYAYNMLIKVLHVHEDKLWREFVTGASTYGT